MQEPCRVYRESTEVAGRLHELGIQEHSLQESVEVGQGHAFGCTKHDPPNLPGILVWGKTVRHLRDLLIPIGWTASNSRGYATVVHPKGSLAIAVAAGDAHTGRADSTPSTRAEKGPATRDAVNENQLTFADVSDAFPRTEAGPAKQTWLLLHFADEESGEVRCELSLPAGMTADGLVSRWRERIILGPVSFEPAQSEHDNREDDGTDEIDIAVEPR